MSKNVLESGYQYLDNEAFFEHFVNFVSVYVCFLGKLSNFVESELKDPVYVLLNLGG